MRPIEAAVHDNPRHRSDNRPAARLLHQFRFCFAGVPYAGEVDVDNPLPLLAFHLQGRIGVGDTGGVNGDIEAAIAAFGQSNGGAQVGASADIAGIRTGPAADDSIWLTARQPAVAAKSNRPAALASARRRWFGRYRRRRSRKRRAPAG